VDGGAGRAGERSYCECARGVKDLVVAELDCEVLQVWTPDGYPRMIRVALAGFCVLRQ